MAKSQTSYGTNTANTLGNSAAGLTEGVQPQLSSYISGLGGANQAEQVATGQGNLATAASGYGNLASTGGFTPSQAQQFVRQATQGTTGTYNVLEQQAKQAADATGGLGTGGALSQMARQLGQAQAGNTLNAETQLNQLQTGNELSGLGGLSSTGTSQANIGQESGQQILSALGLGYGGQGTAGGLLASLSQNPGAANTFLSQLAGLGGAAGGIITGINTK